jgi:hypothetical protein
MSSKFKYILSCILLILISSNGLNAQNLLLKKIISNPDSTFINQFGISTVYKKSKVYYIDSLGKKINKGNLSSTRLHKGQGVIVKRKNITLYNSKGVKIIKFKKKFTHTVYNNVIHIEKTKHKHEIGSWLKEENNFLYANGEEILPNKVDSVYLKKNLLIAKIQKSKNATAQLVPININTTQIIEGSYTYNEIFETQNMFVFNNHYSNAYDLYTPKQDTLYRRVLNHEKLKTNFTQLNLKNDKILINSENQNFVLKANVNDTIEFIDKLIYVYGHNNSKYEDFIIYNNVGNTLLKNVQFVSKIENNNLILMENKKMFISTNTGNSISPYYDFIGELDNGYRLVLNDNSFSFIDNNTYEKLDFELPIIAIRQEDLPNESNFLGELFTAFFRLTLWPAALFDSQIYDALYADHSKNLVYLQPTNNFVDGYLKVSTITIDEESIIILKSLDEFNSFNFINKDGKYLSSKNYLDCSNFSNGMAWVRQKKKNGVVLIDTTGKIIKNYKYDNFEVIEHEYIKTSDLHWHNGWFSDYYYSIYQLYSPAGENVFDCKCKSIYYSKNTNEFVCKKDVDSYEDQFIRYKAE